MVLVNSYTVIERFLWNLCSSKLFSPFLISEHTLCPQAHLSLTCSLSLHSQEGRETDLGLIYDYLSYIFF